MSPLVLIALGALVLVLVIIALSAIRVVQQYERGIIFVLGRLIGAKGPGLFLVPPFVSHMVKVDLRIVTLTVPPQEMISRDNVTIRVTAVVYFYVVDPIAVVNVVNFNQATTQIAHCLTKIFLAPLQASLFLRFCTGLSSKTASSLISSGAGEEHGLR